MSLLVSSILETDLSFLRYYTRFLLVETLVLHVSLLLFETLTHPFFHNFSTGQTPLPDPERWLKKSERTTFQHPSSKKGKKTTGASQGVILEALPTGTGVVSSSGGGGAAGGGGGGKKGKKKK
jgi:hypothetical protein